MSLTRPAVVLACLFAAAPAWAEDVPLEKLPAAVRKAADRAVPKATWAEASREDEAGKTVYTLDGEDARKRAVSVEVLADGTVREVATELAAEEVPAAVRAAVKKKFPKFKPADVYEVRRGGKVAEYHVEGRRPADADDVTLIVSPDGKSVTVAGE